MEYEKLIKVLAYYKQTLANVLEESFVHQATISELQNEIAGLKNEIEELKNNKEEQ